MLQNDERIKRHQTRMRSIYIDAVGAMVSILAGLAGIYLTLLYGYPLKTLFAQRAHDALAVAAAAIYIAAHAVALGTCRLRALNSRLILKLDRDGRQP